MRDTSGELPDCRELFGPQKLAFLLLQSAAADFFHTPDNVIELRVEVARRPTGFYRHGTHFLIEMCLHGLHTHGELRRLAVQPAGSGVTAGAALLQPGQPEPEQHPPGPGGLNFTAFETGVHALPLPPFKLAAGIEQPLDVVSVGPADQFCPGTSRRARVRVQPKTGLVLAITPLNGVEQFDVAGRLHGAASNGQRLNDISTILINNFPPLLGRIGRQHERMEPQVP